MRVFSNAVNNLINQIDGIEPILLVRIYWNSTAPITYSEKESAFYGFSGKIQSIGALEDVIDLDEGSKSQSTDISLDESDGSIKSIFNTLDIHGIKVEILQWFAELPQNEAFILFTGRINGPITWKEGDRTITFSVITTIEDREVGFSVEEGKFSIFPSSLTGKAWPLLFGSVGGMKPLQIIEPPSGITGEGIGIVNDVAWDAELNELLAAYDLAIANQRSAYQAGLNEAYIASQYKSTLSDFMGLENDPSKAQQHDDAAQNYYAQAHQFALEAINIALDIANANDTRDEQLGFNKLAFKVYGNNLPNNTDISFKLSEATYTGRINNGVFTAYSRSLPFKRNTFFGFNQLTDNQYIQKQKSTNDNDVGQKFYWVEAGTTINLLNFPMKYVVSIGVVTVNAVYGYKNGIKISLPSDYYSVATNNYNGLVVTEITLLEPLSSKDESWDSNEFYVDATSLVTNAVDVMTYLINTYTDLTYDVAGFNTVKSLLTNYPVNFVLNDRKNILTVLQEVAFQSRCSIWINDDRFYLRFMPQEQASVDTINEADVFPNSVEITSSETEEVYTKMVASWKAYLDQPSDNKIIYTYNTQKYGIREFAYNFYIFNQQSSVEKAAQFWLIRKANVFKIVKFTTGLHKLKLETFDTVTLNFDIGLVANYTAVGYIRKAVYNSQTLSIDLEVWIPVRFGEMTKYNFAQPKDLNASYIFPVVTDPNARTGNPFDGASGTLTTHLENIPFTRYSPGQLPPISGIGRAIGDVVDVAPPSSTPGVTTILDPAELNRLRPTRLAQANDSAKWAIKPVTPINLPEVTAGSFPGIVRSQQVGAVYNVDVYFNGFGNPVTSALVEVLLIRSDEVIPDGTPVEVVRSIYRNSDNVIVGYLWMQPPLWVRSDTE